MDARHDYCLLQVRGFFPSKLEIDHSHTTSVQCELATPASVSPAPPTSSPFPDANGGTNLQVFDSSDCSTLWLLRVDRMQKGASKEFWVTRGC